MKTTISSARMFLSAAAALLALACASCNEQRNTSGSGVAAGQQRTSAAQLAAAGVTDDDLDLGENWTGSLQQAQRPGAAAGAGADRRGGRGQAQRQSPAQPAQASNPWSIVLNTFSDQNHAEAARNMVANLGSVAPQLVDKAHIRTTDRGSMVLYGHYPDPDDARAKADLQRVKSIAVRDIPVFPRAFLTRAGAAPTQSNHPHALMSVRQRYSNVNPLYTLQVAIWSDLDAGQLTPDEARRRAEAYAAELRAQGFEAYFHQEPGSRMSSVTVGLFDRTSYDNKDGVIDPALQRLIEQFPEYLVNGEPVRQLIDRRNPQKGTWVQEPLLVLVPRR